LASRFPGVPEDSLAYAAVFHEPMVQTPPRGVWGKRGTPKWQTFQGFLGATVDGGSSVEDIVLRYLAAFGPASVSDIRYWSGLSGLREVVERLRPRLRVFADENGRELFDLPHAPRPTDDVPAPVRFLPEYDNVLLSHADRARVIPDKRSVPLYAGDGARAGTLLVDGDLRATWRVAVVDDAATIAVSAAPALSRREADDVSAEGVRLLAFLTPGKRADVVVNAA
jgi:hypothetical protein